MDYNNPIQIFNVLQKKYLEFYTSLIRNNAIFTTSNINNSSKALDNTTLSNLMSNICVQNQYELNYLFIYNESGLCLVESTIDSPKEYNEEEYDFNNSPTSNSQNNNIFNNNKSDIQRVIQEKIRKYIGKVIKKLISKKQKNSKKNIESENDVFSFYGLFFNSKKILIVHRNNLCVTGIFAKSVDTFYQKLLLLNIYISFLNFFPEALKKINFIKNLALENINEINFKNNLATNIKSLSDYTSSSDSSNSDSEQKQMASTVKLKNMHNNLSDQEDDKSNQNLIDDENNTNKVTLLLLNNPGINFTPKNNFFETSLIKKQKETFSYIDFCQIKVFENFFLKNLVAHFKNTFYNLTNPDNFTLYSIELTNYYLLDMDTKNFLFIYKQSSTFLDTKPKVNHLKNSISQHLLNYIILLGKILEEEYQKFSIKHENNENINAYTDFKKFYKFECIGTYPRLIFYINYMPILNGCLEIHEYTQTKLSHQIDQSVILNLIPNENKTKTNKNYDYIDNQNKKLKTILSAMKIREYFTLLGNNSNINYDDIKYLSPYRTKILQFLFYNFLNGFYLPKDLGLYSLYKDYPLYFDNYIITEILKVIKEINQHLTLDSINGIVTSKLREISHSFRDEILSDKENPKDYRMIIDNYLSKRAKVYDNDNHSPIYAFLKNLTQITKKFLLQSYLIQSVSRKSLKHFMSFGIQGKGDDSVKDTGNNFSFNMYVAQKKAAQKCSSKIRHNTINKKEKIDNENDNENNLQKTLSENIYLEQRNRKKNEYMSQVNKKIRIINKSDNRLPVQILNFDKVKAKNLNIKVFKEDTLKFSTKSLAYNRDRDLSVYESDSSYSKQKYFDPDTDLVVKIDTQMNKKVDGAINFRRISTEDDLRKQKYGNIHFGSKVKRKSMVNYLQRRNSFFEEEGDSNTDDNVNSSKNVENTNQLMLKNNKSSFFKVLNLNNINDKIGSNSNSNSKIISGGNKNMRFLKKK